MLLAPPLFTCARSDGGFGAALVHLSGELDLATAPQLDQTLREAQLDARLVVLDLRELAFMDCAGMRVIVDAAERARRDGRRLIVVRGAPNVDRLFTLTGTAERIDISDHEPRQPPTDRGLRWLAAANGAPLLRAEASSRLYKTTPPEESQPDAGRSMIARLPIGLLRLVAKYLDGRSEAEIPTPARITFISTSDAPRGESARAGAR